MFYPNTTAGLRKHIFNRYPSARPMFKEVDSLRDDWDRICYALWMLDHLQTLTDGDPIVAAARRGRWMGYIHRELEVLGIATNSQIRALMRLDLLSLSPQ